MGVLAETKNGTYSSAEYENNQDTISASAPADRCPSPAAIDAECAKVHDEMLKKYPALFEVPAWYLEWEPNYTKSDMLEHLIMELIGACHILKFPDSYSRDGSTYWNAKHATNTVIRAVMADASAPTFRDLDEFRKH